ncbi:MAG: SUMF1/EgtB/PvdO family nonheme iron enzyme, partial [Planctomycetes bacterium]|nr:SUMF1/EgtB/PvdO family nonheme iron enzyme [Planctomycetota bacterium]
EAADEAARQKLEGKAVDCLMKKRRAFLDQAVKAFNNEAWRQAGDYARDTLAVRLADPAEVAAGAGGDATGAGDAPELDAATAARAREIAEESRRFNSKQQDEQYVPGGNFHYGSMRAGDHNDPGDAVVGAFYIDTYEVRNGDYYKFVADGGYENAAWWDAEIVGEVQFFVDQDDKPGPATWFGGTFPAKTESMPVAGVSWWEARAYARWFSAQQLARRLLPKKLPTDHQWEKAAAWDPRANRAHTYAFGDAGEWSLTKGHFAAEMRPVDVGFRQFDRSHYGVQDMTGNVAEWVESARPGERAVIRGGSFGFDERMAREIAWLARRVTPRERRYRPPNVGFRLLSPIRDAADRSDAEYDQWVQDVRARAGRQAPVPRQKSAPAAPSETPEKESPPSREADGAPKAGARSWTAVPVPADPGSESGAGAAPTPSPAPAEPPAPEKEPSAPAAPSNAPPASENEPRAPDNGERGASEAPPTGPLPDAAGGSE